MMSTGLSLTVSLVNGWVREFQDTLSTTIIPAPVINLCIQFYQIHKSLIYLKCMQAPHPPIIKMATIHSKSPRIISVCSNENSAEISNIGNIAITNAGICMKSNFRLSRSVTNSLPNSSKSSAYDVIFSVGGSKKFTQNSSKLINEATALIIDHKSYNNDASNIPAYVWKLPSFERSNSFDITHIVYSNIYGLIKIQDDITRLPFNHHLQNSPTWSWQGIADLSYVKIGSSADEDSTANYIFAGYQYRSVALINDEQLVLCGGYSGSEAVNTVLLCDIRQGIFTELPCLSRMRCRAGLYMDNNKDRLYIGGGGRGEFGQFGLGIVEWMDMNKCDKWIRLPYTKHFHNGYPVLWIEDGNMLYITSCGKIIERCDLRENKEWESVFDDESDMINCDDLFGLDKPKGLFWRDLASERLII